jgi:FAD:protein FMN transferase
MQFEALGTRWLISLGVNKLDEHERAIQELITQFEHRYSRFDPNSLISRLNSSGTLDHPPEELLQILEQCISLWRETNGLFNPTVGGALVKLGYGKGKEGTIADNLPDILQLSSESISLSPGYSLDLGGIGKGWLIDSIASYCDNQEIREWIINGGGDIRLRQSKPATLLIAHPHDQGKSIGSVAITRGAVATSTTHLRKWHTDGKFNHHIIDPLTGKSKINALASVTVIAETATTADTSATCLLLMNNELQRTWQPSSGHISRICITESLEYWHDFDPRFDPIIEIYI